MIQLNWVSCSDSIRIVSGQLRRTAERDSKKVKYPPSLSPGSRAAAPVPVSTLAGSPLRSLAATDCWVSIGRFRLRAPVSTAPLGFIPERMSRRDGRSSSSLLSPSWPSPSTPLLTRSPFRAFGVTPPTSCQVSILLGLLRFEHRPWTLSEPLLPGCRFTICPLCWSDAVRSTTSTTSTHSNAASHVACCRPAPLRMAAGRPRITGERVALLLEAAIVWEG